MTLDFRHRDGQAADRRRRALPLWWICIGLVGLAAFVALFRPGQSAHIDTFSVVDFDAKSVRTALYAYKATFWEYPVGDSAAVFRALRGENPSHIVFLECRPTSVSPDCALFDPWGTPYMVYFAGNDVLIRSAGPNKRFDNSGRGFDDYIR